MAEGTPVGRRVVLGMLTLGAVGVAAGGPLSRTAASVGRSLAGGSGQLSELLPGGWRFYNVTASEPVRTAADYTLTLSGLVDAPLTLTLAQLHVLPRTSLTSDFQCVTGWRVPKVHWAGVRLGDLLDRAHVRPTATAVTFVSFDGAYTESLTLPQARRRDVLVADTMDGRPLPRDHGGPVRLLVAPMYGYKSCKWLGGIRVVDHLQGGYWEQFGYDQNAWVGRSNGRHDAPTGNPG